MKKFAKMSLAAAIAVGGLTSSASAVDLEQAIKGVDISGQVRYRMEDNATAIGTDQEDQDVNIDIMVKVPVNDNVNFIANLNIDNDDQGDANVTLGGSSAFGLDQYYFQYINGPVTVHLGSQEIPGRMTDGLIGQGIVGLYNAGAFTIGAASFYNTEVTNNLVDASVHSVIAMGSVGPVSLLAQYAVAEDVVAGYNLKADATFGPITTGLEYTAKELDDEHPSYSALTDDERSTFKAYVAGKMDIVSASLAYVQTGDNGSGSLDEGVETASEFLLWQMGSAGVAELNAWALDVSVAVTDSVSVRAAYGDGEATAADVDVTETLGQVSYKMSKNLNTYIRYSQYELNGVENDRGRVEVKYTF